MKKVISIIIGLLCVCATYAINYASPYKGSVSRHTTHIVHSGITSMPTASMGSVNTFGSTGSRGITSNMSGIAAVQPIRGIYTSATSIRGGVTADQAYSRMNAPRKTPEHPDDAEECENCIDDGNGTCIICGHDMDDCTCNPCRCPIEWDWSVLAFLSLLSFAYIAYKKRQKMSNFA